MRRLAPSIVATAVLILASATAARASGPQWTPIGLTTALRTPRDVLAPLGDNPIT